MQQLLQISSIVISVLVLLVLINNFGDCADSSKEKLTGTEEDQIAEESVQVIHPMTLSTAVEAEIKRMQSLQDVFPPKDLSYYIPYGDRTIAAFQFPHVTEKQITPPGGKPGQADNGALPNQTTKPYVGLLISQNYIYRQNVRDFGNLLKLNRSRPSNEIVIELARAFAERNEQLINPYGGYGGGSQSKWTPKITSFVIVAIESRLRSSDNSKFNQFGFTNSLTNGTIIFPSASNPSLLTNIPFVLRHKEDIDHVFDGFGQGSQGLVLKSRMQIKNFLGLLSDVHDDVHEEGRQKIQLLRQASSRLKQPDQFLNPNQSWEDRWANAERMAKKTDWLYTSTVGIRSVTHTPLVSDSEAKLNLVQNPAMAVPSAAYEIIRPSELISTSILNSKGKLYTDFPNNLESDDAPLF